MGHVVNPINFRLGTVKMWNSNAFSDIKNIKYNGYFAVISYNIYFFLSKVFRSRFFTYVTSFIFSHIKLFWKYNKILCFIFLFNGASEFGGHKTSSLISFFFPKEKHFFRKLKKNKEDNINKKTSISLFSSRFFFETGFSYNFFYKMWINKKLRYYGIYKPIMIDQIKRDAYIFLFKTKTRTFNSTFERFLFKHMMYKRKELRKKWNKINNNKIKIKKHFRRFLLKRFLKYIYYIPVNKPIYLKINTKPSIVSLKYYRNLKKFRNFAYNFSKKKIQQVGIHRYYSHRVFFNLKANIKNRKNLKKTKKRFFTFSRSFKARSYIFQEAIFRNRRNRLKKRSYVLNMHNKFKFLINKFIKKLKFILYKVFIKKTINIYYFFNKIFDKIKMFKKTKNSFPLSNTKEYLIIIYLFHRKIKLYNLFKKGFYKININKFKIDLIFSKIISYNLEIGLLKYTSWNVQKKLQKILGFIFKGLKFKFQFHFVSIKNINAKIISYYIAVRLKQKYRIAPVLRDVKRYCNSAKQVRGWKLTCAGRFSKKEIASYIVLKGGSFGYSSITSLLDYSFNPVILKYSICGIKVWFVLKKNFKKISSFKASFVKILLQKSFYKRNNEKKKKIFKCLKKNTIKHKIKNEVIKIRSILTYFNFKNLLYKRLNTRSSMFWSIWRKFIKKYKFIF